MATSPSLVARTRRRDAEIVALAGAGLPPRRIAGAVGVTVGNAAYRLHVARGRKEPAPRFDCKGRIVADAEGRPTGDIHFTLRRADIGRMVEAASKRGVSPARLAHEIVRAVLLDGLVDAVLDE